MTATIPENSQVPLPGIKGLDAEQLQIRLKEFTRMMMTYDFAISEVTTKMEILQAEFEHLHEYNPIETISSRLKSAESVLEKMRRRGVDFDMESIAQQITDIAGVRIICSFISDAYRILDMFTHQEDVTVLKVKDYISEPKDNGYRSLHAIVQVPVFLSDRTVPVTVEVQIRTIAQDFWASLEHKIYYKYSRDVPRDLLSDMSQAAERAHELDKTMESIHKIVSAQPGAKVTTGLQERLLSALTAGNQLGFIQDSND